MFEMQVFNGLAKLLPSKGVAQPGFDARILDGFSQDPFQEVKKKFTTEHGIQTVWIPCSVVNRRQG